MDLLTKVLEISVAMFPVILLLLFASPLLGKHYGARLRCFMWLALSVRMLIPFNTTLINAIPIQTLPTFGEELAENTVYSPEWEEPGLAQTAGEPTDGTTATKPAKAPASIRLTPALILPAIWGLGAGMFLLYHLLAYFHTYRKLWRWSTRVTDQHLLRRFALTKRELGVKREVRLRRSAKAASPLLIGLLRPCIILPHAPLDSIQLDFILYHELTHLKRGDLWFKLAALLANAVHWFNPLVWMMALRVGFDTELACDTDVLAGTGRDVRRQYGYTVLAFIEQGWRDYGLRRWGTPLTSRFLGGKKQMKQRLTNITDTSTKRRGFVAMFAIVLIIALAGSTVYAADNAPKKASYPEFKYTVTHMTRYTSDLPDSDMLSMEKAAEAGAKYIYDFYGENGEGNTIWMSYMSGNNTWGGRVTKTGSELKAGNILFSIIIDAEHGKRIRILDMRNMAEVLPGKTMTGEEISKLKTKIPDNFGDYKKLAAEFAQKHFNDGQVAGLDYNGMGLICDGARMKIVDLDPAESYTYTETLISFIATDAAGSQSEIVFVMETGKLREISGYTSDAEKEALRAERQSRAEPGRTVIIGN